ncbi:MAG TPA: carboxypeptidase-like regulatory domain-containing protein, partial [Thermomicrobiales bacterium]|nr:carboxypeptidase-like regulatory domain-containing protein [Thermomicrobiales bacterium]
MPQASSTRKQDGRPLEWLTWPFSLLLPIALLLLLVSLAVAGNDPRTVVLTVRDESGEPLPQAQVVVDDELFLTDANGQVRLEAVDANKDVTVHREGYVTMVGTLEENTSSDQEVVLQAEKSSNAMDAAMAEKPFATTLIGQESGVQQQDSTPAATASPKGESNTASKQIAGTVTNGAGEPVGSAW